MSYLVYRHVQSLLPSASAQYPQSLAWSLSPPVQPNVYYQTANSHVARAAAEYIEYMSMYKTTRRAHSWLRFRLFARRTAPHTTHSLEDQVLRYPTSEDELMHAQRLHVARESVPYQGSPGRERATLAFMLEVAHLSAFEVHPHVQMQLLCDGLVQ